MKIPPENVMNLIHNRDKEKKIRDEDKQEGEKKDDIEMRETYLQGETQKGFFFH